MKLAQHQHTFNVKKKTFIKGQFLHFNGRVKLL